MDFNKIEEDIPLNREERKEKISILKSTPFEKFIVHSHFLNKFDKPRHGVTIEKAKEIYSQFDKIIDVSKRPALNGFKYCFIYRVNKKISYSLIFLLDEKPMKLFNAIPKGRNIEARLTKKYFGYFTR